MGVFSDVKNSGCYLDDLSEKYSMESKSLCGASKMLSPIIAADLESSNLYYHSAQLH